RLIENSFRAIPKAWVVKAIGDDAAIARFRGSSSWAFSTDAFVEGVHFIPEVHSPPMAGAKALSRAVSDLAAVGATPRFFLMNLALPAHRTGKWLADFLSGMAQAARRFDVDLIGGDTTRAPQGNGASVNLTVVGEFVRCHPVLRSGAKPGDIVFLSGTAGAAQLGLELIRRGKGHARSFQPLLRKHFKPEPRIGLGTWLAQNRLATAMIDTSDGLSTDLRNLCDASKVGAVLDWKKVPAVEIPSELQRFGFDREKIALHGGDDYELLFTVSPRNLKKLPQRWQNVPLSPIGEIVVGKEVSLMDSNGKRRELRPLGWDPFRNSK
ncbi:MAG: thiamine-phosphate kinase, partial [Acidobacteria bacterium]|nr:thiamine-phosphate kinase [Acidobacteriota bacterium]